MLRLIMRRATAMNHPLNMLTLAAAREETAPVVGDVNKENRKSAPGGAVCAGDGDV